MIDVLLRNLLLSEISVNTKKPFSGWKHFIQPQFLLTLQWVYFPLFPSQLVSSPLSIQALADIINANLTITASNCRPPCSALETGTWKTSKTRAHPPDSQMRGGAGAILDVLNTEILNTEIEPRRWLQSKLESNLIPLSAKLQQGWEAGNGERGDQFHSCSRKERKPPPTYTWPWANHFPWFWICHIKSKQFRGVF